MLLETRPSLLVPLMLRLSQGSAWLSPAPQISVCGQPGCSELPWGAQGSECPCRDTVPVGSALGALWLPWGAQGSGTQILQVQLWELCGCPGAV